MDVRRADFILEKALGLEEAVLDRDGLGFVSRVEELFVPYLCRFGYEEVGADPYTVHFHGANGWLTVAHDRLSYELDIWIRLPAHDERPLGMADLIRVSNPHDADAYRCFAATSASDVAIGVRQLFDDFQAYAPGVLGNDPQFLERLVASRSAHIAAFSQEVSGKRRDEAIRAAISTKDWATVVRLYGDADVPLTKVEEARLRYARKQLQHG